MCSHETTANFICKFFLLFFCATRLPPPSPHSFFFLHLTLLGTTGNSLVALYQTPTQLALLRSNPSLIHTALDELLRFQSPNQFGNRQLSQDYTLNGTPLKKGTRIHIAIGAANRDPATFPDPDTLDLSRSPNPHLAFAAGAHKCLGEKLAKMEGRVAIGEFVRRFPDYRVDLERCERSLRARFRGFVKVPCFVNG